MQTGGAFAPLHTPHPGTGGEGEVPESPTHSTFMGDRENPLESTPSPLVGEGRGGRAQPAFTVEPQIRKSIQPNASAGSRRTGGQGSAEPVPSSAAVVGERIPLLPELPRATDGVGGESIPRHDDQAIPSAGRAIRHFTGREVSLTRSAGSSNLLRRPDNAVGGSPIGVGKVMNRPWSLPYGPP